MYTKKIENTKIQKYNTKNIKYRKNWIQKCTVSETRRLASKTSNCATKTKYKNIKTQQKYREKITKMHSVRDAAARVQNIELRDQSKKWSSRSSPTLAAKCCRDNWNHMCLKSKVDVQHRFWRNTFLILEKMYKYGKFRLQNNVQLLFKSGHDWGFQTQFHQKSWHGCDTSPFLAVLGFWTCLTSVNCAHWWSNLLIR